MVKYKCGTCRAKLETDDALGGEQERCPSCGALNTVPTTTPEKDPVEELAKGKRIGPRKVIRKERPPRPARVPAGPRLPDAGMVMLLNVVGALLSGVGMVAIVAGVVGLSVSPSFGSLIAGGLAGFLSGVLFLAFAVVLTHTGRIVSAVERIAGQGQAPKPEPPMLTPAASD